ncbi:MAG: PIN domain-containing protein [Nanoarchaeota archaeon]|nr:PIN domain-containing protein [Nanoarchaeota archaeon]
MKLILDTNSLFSFFWRGSLVTKLLLKEHELCSPEFALEELDKHKSEICKKTKLSSSEFEEFKTRLKNAVRFIAFSGYSDKIPEAFELLPEHPKDIDFLALSLKISAALVSDDKELLKQSKVEIFNKSRLSELL